MKKILSVLLIIILIFSLCSFSAFAVDNGAINTRDLDFIASVQVLNSSGTSVVQHDVTNEIIVDTTNAEVVKDYVRYTFPSSKNFNTQRTLASLLIFSNSKFNSSHEYNLKFNYAFNKPLAFSCTVALKFLDNSGTFLKEQILYQSSHNTNENNMSHLVDIDFKLNTDGIDSGYKCDLIISFAQDGYNSTDVQRFYVSPEIYLTDKDDNTSFFERIIQAIKDLPSKIQGFFTDLRDSIYNYFVSLSLTISNKLSSLGDRISGFFDNLSLKITELGESIIEGLKSLFIPSDDYFSNSFNDLVEFFENKFGLFALPFTLILRILNLYSNIGNGSGKIYLMPFDIFNTSLWELQEIDLKSLILNFNVVLQGKFGFDLYDFYLTFVDVLLFIAFARLIKRKYNSMFDTGAFDQAKEIYNERKGR